MVVALFVLAVGGIAAFLTMIASLMKNSDPYQQAVGKAKESSAVVELLGEPIEEGFMPSGSVNTSGSSGSAQLDISLSGSIQGGTVYVQAGKTAGTWSYDVLMFRADSGEEVNLSSP